MSCWSQTTQRQNGELAIGGIGVSQLAAAVGTPCYVLDELDLRCRARQWREAFTAAFGAIGVKAQVFYGGKALLTTQLARVLVAQGLAIDAATDGEMEVLARAGVPGELIGLHGNNKSDAEIETAIQMGVAHLTIDCLDEIDRVAAAARKAGIRMRVQVRVVPGIKVGDHDHISTGHADQKFGLSPEYALTAVQAILASRNLEYGGLHAHIGSQIVQTEPFVAAVTMLARLRTDISRITGYLAPELDFGGGFGVAYTPEQTGISPQAVAQIMAASLKEQCEADEVAIPDVSIEPGRAIVGPAVTTLYTVGSTKTVDIIAGQRRYVSVDGGMSDNIRPPLYQARYHCELASRTSKRPTMLSRVVGRHCESGDIVVPDIDLPADVHRGDVLAVPGTGAYCLAMGSNYNKVLRPPLVAVAQGRAELWQRRETFADLLATDVGSQRVFMGEQE